jgi:DNA-binding NtrC family response regulator
MSALTEVIRTGESPVGLRVRRAVLQVSSGGAAGKRLASPAARLTVGSQEGNDLVLPDATVSRFHAELERAADGWRIRDLGSTNGTQVNGVRVLDAYLGDQATLTFGATAVRFEVTQEQEDVPLHPEPRFGALVGESVAMRALFAQLDRLARTAATVLVLGESGTGKELIAEAVHQKSPRAGKPFIVVDCGAIPAELVESELFGHERGAFTGATSDRKGAFEAADGGTLFLDEIGELPLAVQPRLLRALERRQVKRVGADAHRSVDVRFIAATHRDLRQAVNQGTFREDLYFRLAVAQVRVPPLRERPDDLPLLLRHLWDETFRALGLPARPFTAPGEETMRHLSRLPWEGNVRELRNFVERSVALSGDLDASRLAVPSASPGAGAGAAAAGPEVRTDLPYHQAKEAWLEVFEKAYLSHRLQKAGGNVSQMAREAEVDRAHLIKLLKKYAVR